MLRTRSALQPEACHASTATGIWDTGKRGDLNPTHDLVIESVFTAAPGDVGRLLSRVAAVYPSAAREPMLSIEDKPLPLQHVLRSKMFIGGCARAELVPLLNAHPVAWLSGSELRGDATFKKNGSSLIEGGAEPELLLLGAAEAGHAAAGEWLVAEYVATGLVSVMSGDGSRRIARDVGAASNNKAASDFFSALGAFLGRYAMEGAVVHKSSTSIVKYARDLRTDTAVCVKCMKNLDQFESELSGRFVDGQALSTDDVIGVLHWHTPEAEPLSDGSGKTQEPEASDAADKYPYVLVMEKGVRSLHQACDVERMAGYDLEAIRKAITDTLSKLQSLHAKGVVHGDLKQRNILRRGTGDWILCDMDAAAKVGSEIGSKTSSAYAPPELAKFKYTDSGTKVLKHAETSFDVWSAGVILYELCAGHKLFAQDTANDELIEFDDKTRLCTWSCMQDAELTDALAAKEKNTDGELVLVINDEQARADAKNLIRWCLKGNPDERPTVKQMLAHRFFYPQALEPKQLVELYHGFLSHAQADASGTAAAMYFAYKVCVNAAVNHPGCSKTTLPSPSWLH